MIGAAASAANQIQSARAQAAIGRADAALDRRRARVGLEAAGHEAGRELAKGERALAAQRAGFLASGVALEGTPVEVLADMAAENQLDVDAIRHGARIRAGEELAQAWVHRARARTAQVGGTLGALSSLTGGLQRVTRLAPSFAQR
jgi:hypothetical protein